MKKLNFLGPAAIVFLAIIILATSVNVPLHNSSPIVNPAISATSQTIYIFQGNRLIWTGPGNTSGDSFSVGEYTQDANVSITYNATIFEPCWTIDGAHKTATNSYTISLAPGTYTYTNGQAPSTGIYGYIAIKTGNCYYVGFNVTTVNPPKPIISVSSTSVQAGTPVTFNGTASEGIGSSYNYTWQFGDGTNSTVQNLTHTYAKAGTYQVNLTATDYTGGSGTTSTNITVTQPPAINASENVNRTDTGQAVQFTSNVSYASSPYYVNWTANSQIIGSTQNLTYAFSKAGNYTIQAILSDNGKNYTSANLSLEVNATPGISLSESLNQTDISIPVKFSINASYGTPPYNYSWIFDNQTVSNSQNYTRAFNQSGVFTLEGQIVDQSGVKRTSNISIKVNPNLTAEIYSSINPTVAGKGVSFSPGISGGTGTITYLWQLNGNNETTNKDFNYTFQTAANYTITLIAKDSLNTTAEINLTERVNLFVSVSDTSPSGIAPLTESFDSSVLGGSSYTYSWNFGNGATSVSSSPSETFGIGNFTVNLTVTDQSGFQGYATLEVQSLPEPVSLSYSPTTNVTVLTSVNFEAKPAWYASNSSILWTLPNGNQYSSLSFNYTFPVYSASNSVFVQFQYYDNGSRSYNTSMDVKMVPSIPVLQVSGIKSTILVNTTLTLNASSSFSYDAAIQDYQWTYNNVTYGNPVQSFFFSNTGTSNVTLKITDSLGAIASETFHISIVKPSESSSINISVNVTGGSQFVNFRINVTSNQAIQSVEAVGVAYDSSRYPHENGMGLPGGGGL